MRRKGSIGIDTGFLKREGLRLELMKSEYNCYSQQQKKDIFSIMSNFNLGNWSMDEIRDFIKNETFKRNIDRLCYIYSMRDSEDKRVASFAYDLVFNLISKIIEGEEVDFDLVVKMFQEYTQNGSQMHRVEVWKLIEELSNKRYNEYFNKANKLPLFKSTIHSTEKGYALGNRLLHIYNLCEKRDVSEHRAWLDYDMRKKVYGRQKEFVGRDFDSFEAFNLVKKAYEGAFDDDSVATELIDQSFVLDYSVYSVDEDLLEYSKEAFDEAFALFKTLSERLKKGGCSQSGSSKYLKDPVEKSIVLK